MQGKQNAHFITEKQNGSFLLNVQNTLDEKTMHQYYSHLLKWNNTASIITWWGEQ